MTMLPDILRHLEALVSFDTRNPPRRIGTGGMFAYLRAQLPGFRVEVDPEALLEYFTFQNILSDRTLFKGVRLLPPGSTMTIGPSCRILTFVVNSARATRLPFAVHFPYLYVPVTPSALTTIWPHLPSLNFPPYVWGTRASAKAGAADIMRAAAAAMSDVRMCHFLSAVLPKKCRAEECDSV